MYDDDYDAEGPAVDSTPDVADASEAGRSQALASEGAVEESALPRFRVELTCPTPVLVRMAEYHAEQQQEAEGLHRRANGLVGTIAGAMRTTLLKRDEETGDWVPA